MLREIVRRARAANRAAVMVTFEPHPLSVIAPDRSPCLLTTLREKRLLWPLFELDYVFVLRFTEAIRRLTPEEFVQQVLVDQLRVGELVIGYDHGFGKNRSGDVDTLRGLGHEAGFDVDLVDAVEVADENVSSTAIRGALAEADFDRARELLGRPYTALGEVVMGDGRGAEIGYPTANLSVEDSAKCLPPEGVYAVRVQLDGDSHAGMANLGGQPTFSDDSSGLEVHLFDWSRPLYGTWLEVEFVRRLRSIRRFEGPHDLVRQLDLDREAARSVLRAPLGEGSEGVA